MSEAQEIAACCYKDLNVSGKVGALSFSISSRQHRGVKDWKPVKLSRRRR